MSTSQNGWPIVAKSACDQGPFHGVTFPNGILAGDVAVIARWQLGRYAATVEPLVQGTCWGWFVKVIEGTTTKSNHGSATAWDVNADQHPMGVDASHNFSAAQIKACRAIVAESDGVLRWGGDYSSRPDPMHWEINDDKAAAHALATKIKKDEAAMADATLSTATKDDIAARAVDQLGTRDNVFASPSWAASHADNPFWNYAATFGYAMEDTHASLEQLKLENALIKTQLATILSAIADLPGSTFTA